MQTIVLRPGNPGVAFPSAFGDYAHVNTYPFVPTTGEPDMSNKHIIKDINVLSNIGVYGSNIYGSIQLTALPNFLQPLVTYDVSHKVETISSVRRDLTNPTEIKAEIMAIAGEGYSEADIMGALGIVDWTEITHWPRTINETRNIDSSNMRFSLNGFKNLGSDTITSSNILAKDLFSSNVRSVSLGVSGTVNVNGDIKCDGTITAKYVKSTSGDDLGAAQNTSETALAFGVLGSIAGIVGAGAGFAALFGGTLSMPKAIGDFFKDLFGGGGDNKPPPLKDENGNTAKTLRQLIMEDKVSGNPIFTSEVNAVIKNYLTNEDNVVNLFEYVLDGLNPNDKPTHGGVRYFEHLPGQMGQPRTHKGTRVGKAFMEVVNRAGKVAGFQLIENPGVASAIDASLAARAATIATEAIEIVVADGLVPEIGEIISVTQENIREEILGGMAHGLRVKGGGIVFL